MNDAKGSRDAGVASEAPSDEQSRAGLSRRDLLRLGATGAAALATSAVAQESGPAGPAVNTGTVAGMRFRAFVRYGTEGSIEELQLRDIKPTQVLVRTRGSCGC